MSTVCPSTAAAALGEEDFDDDMAVDAAVAEAVADEEEGGDMTEDQKVKVLMKSIPVEMFTDRNLKGAINLAEVTNVELSLKTPITVSAARKYFTATGDSPETQLLVATGAAAAEGGVAIPRIGRVTAAEFAESMVVIKATDAKMRRFVLAVSVNRAVPLLVAFAKHQAFANASLNFRRLYGSGVRQRFTLGERIAYAAASPPGKLVIATAFFLWENKFCRQNILDFDLSFHHCPIAITPARIVTACIVTKVALDVYYTHKYAAREAKLGVKWQWKKDAMECTLCETKFPTTAVRRERSKHHCRMCGRVMCHACAGSYLFYPVENRRMRTCDACVSNGGPPEECVITDTSNQRSVFTLLCTFVCFRGARKSRKQNILADIALLTHHHSPSSLFPPQPFFLDEQQKAQTAAARALKAKQTAQANVVKMRREKDETKRALMELENEEAVRV